MLIFHRRLPSNQIGLSWNHQLLTNGRFGPNSKLMRTLIAVIARTPCPGMEMQEASEAASCHDTYKAYQLINSLAPKTVHKRIQLRDKLANPLGPLEALA